MFELLELYCSNNKSLSQDSAPKEYLFPWARLPAAVREMRSSPEQTVLFSSRGRPRERWKESLVLPYSPISPLPSTPPPPAFFLLLALLLNHDLIKAQTIHVLPAKLNDNNRHNR